MVSFCRRLSANRSQLFPQPYYGITCFPRNRCAIRSQRNSNKESPVIFNGQILIVVVTIVSFLGLYYVSDRLIHRAEKKSVSNISTSYVSSEKHLRALVRTTQQQEQLIKPIAISLMIAIGIGLHNFGEGLAISTAVLLGQVAFSLVPDSWILLYIILRKDCCGFTNGKK